jgi:hypothetical protein
VKDTESWLEWEDYPELDEVSFRLVDEQAQKIGQATLDRSRELDSAAGIDSAEIAERVS